MNRPHPLGKGRGMCGYVLASEVSCVPTSLNRGEGPLLSHCMRLRLKRSGEGEGSGGEMKEDEQRSTVMRLIFLFKLRSSTKDCVQYRRALVR